MNLGFAEAINGYIHTEFRETEREGRERIWDFAPHFARTRENEKETKITNRKGL